MTTTAGIDPDHDAPDPSLDAQAAASLGALFKANPSIAADMEEAGRAHAHRQQERQRELDALAAQVKAEQKGASLNAKLDLAGQRFAGFTVGAVVVFALLMFDAIPLNWAAQAFERQARAAVASCREARRPAEEKMQRNWTVLLRMLREWSITSDAPAGVSQAYWNAALERALRALFSGQ